MRCANCNTTLPSADAICQNCDKKLWHSPIFSGQAYEIAKPYVPDAGKFECPQCHKHFDTCSNIYSPPKTKWWKPQDLVPVCPHCETRLFWHSAQPVSRAALIWRSIALAGIAAFFGLHIFFVSDLNAFWSVQWVDRARLVVQLSAFIVMFQGMQSLLPAAGQAGDWRLEQPYSKAISNWSLALILIPLVLILCAYFFAGNVPNVPRAWVGYAGLVASISTVLGVVAAFVAQRLASQRAKAP